MSTFQDINAWKLAHKLVLSVYDVTKNFPEGEKFGLISQFQRAAVSVPANIAEGFKRISRADKLRFYNIAEGSLEETRYYVILSRDICYINEDQYNQLIQQVENTSKALIGYSKGVLKSDFGKTC